MRSVVVKGILSMAAAIAFSQSAVAETQAGSEQVFKLYDSPDHAVTPMCDAHTKLSLYQAHRDSPFYQVRMFNAVDGACDLFVEPAPRQFKNLKLVEKRCGSLVYRNEENTIQIIDNRSRQCQDVVIAPVVVDYKHNNKNFKLFGDTAQPENAAGAFEFSAEDARKFFEIFDVEYTPVTGIGINPLVGRKSLRVGLNALNIKCNERLYTIDCKLTSNAPVTEHVYGNKMVRETKLNTNASAKLFEALDIEIQIPEVGIPEDPIHAVKTFRGSNTTINCLKRGFRVEIPECRITKTERINVTMN